LSGAVLAGVLVLVFFLAGIAVGIVAVIAMSARRAHEPGERDWTDGEVDGWDEDNEDSEGGPGATPPFVGWPS
jgi:hypothetical protein